MALSENRLALFGIAGWRWRAKHIGRQFGLCTNRKTKNRVDVRQNPRGDTFMSV
jgi:hypothetical protein